MNWTTVIGFAAACGTTVSYIFQLKKCWQTRKVDDLSLPMFAILATGVALWIVYGVLQQDIVVIVANVVSLVFLLGILYFKLTQA